MSPAAGSAGGSPPGSVPAPRAKPTYRHRTLKSGPSSDLSGSVVVLDADGHVVGRLASHVAKRLLRGEEIAIVNAEKALVSGRRRQVVGAYREMRAKGSPGKGPFFPRPPDRILKRTIRGMLPHKQGRGREALGRLRVYLGTPPELAGVKAQKIPDASPARLSTIPIEKISRELGWRPAPAMAPPPRPK